MRYRGNNKDDTAPRYIIFGNKICPHEWTDERGGWTAQNHNALADTG